VIEVYEPEPHKAEQQELPEEYWEELFSDPPLPAGTTSQAIIDELNR